MTDLLPLLLGAVLASHVLVGLDAPADATPARVRALGPATALLATLAAPAAWCLEAGLSASSPLQALRLFLQVPLLLALAWASVALQRRLRPAAAPGLLPVVLNGAGLGAMQGAIHQPDLLAALAMGATLGLGFWLLVQVSADLQARLPRAHLPRALQGAPALLIGTGLLGLALLGLDGVLP
ncbi:electron transporter RnfA [Pseudomonas mangiferae]|uniref:Electron transporter RnfA n=1 Tax=Pseudomonas mangiferae TaxID=2593654 RepID=A0A553GW73_9PSED|nr:electron transporter RnfA [Pseudomonas mangiferae]TRX73739.1 electron transporter RnfA [Pseudomonas mangiferae]